MKVTFTSYLMASTAAAAVLPIHQRSSTTSKNILLWDYTNTAQVQKTQSALNEAAADVAAISNWNCWRPSEAPTDLPFYPTVRTAAQLTGDDWTQCLASIETEVAAGRTCTVQFYNEPEYLGLSAADAASAWRTSMLPLRQKYGCKLVGVGTSSSTDGIAFQDAFMAALGDTEKPDYIGVHYYTTAGNAVASEITWGQNYITEAHTKYGLPLFVNEIACTSTVASEVTEFSETFKTWMDQQDFIAKYGFFGATLTPVNSFVSEAAQLLTTVGTWTSLGKTLLSISSK